MKPFFSRAYSLYKAPDHNFFEVLHISVGPKIKILESRTNFRDFSAKNGCSFLKLSNFELENS